MSHTRSPLTLFKEMGVSPPSEVLSGAFNENLFDSVVNIAVASQVTANARIILRNYIREINLRFLTRLAFGLYLFFIYYFFSIISRFFLFFCFTCFFYIYILFVFFIKKNKQNIYIEKTVKKNKNERKNL